MGMFNYGGRIVSNNSSVDFMYVREGRPLSVQAFKAFDLYDLHTDMNFAAVFLYKNFNVGKRLVVAPCGGFVATQLHSIADRDSDLAVRLVLSYKVSPELTLEHTAIITNLVLETDYLDWVNRFRITYSKKSFDAYLSVWHNNKVFDPAAYFTAALSVAYARVRVTGHLLLNTSITSVNYCIIFTHGQRHIISRTLKDVEESLQQHNFLRVHKSHMVYLAKIVRYLKQDGGTLILADKSEIPVGRQSREELERRLLIL